MVEVLQQSLFVLISDPLQCIVSSATPSYAGQRYAGQDPSVQIYAGQHDICGTNQIPVVILQF